MELQNKNLPGPLRNHKTTFAETLTRVSMLAFRCYLQICSLRKCSIWIKTKLQGIQYILVDFKKHVSNKMNRVLRRSCIIRNGRNYRLTGLHPYAEVHNVLLQSQGELFSAQSYWGIKEPNCLQTTLPLDKNMKYNLRTTIQTVPAPISNCSTFSKSESFPN